MTALSSGHRSPFIFKKLVFKMLVFKMPQSEDANLNATQVPKPKKSKVNVYKLSHISSLS
jgi:hypothetical protein